MGSFGSSKSSEKSGSKSFLPIQEDVLTDFLSSQRGTIGAGQQSFPGQRTADFSELQERALELAPGALFRTPEQEADLFKFGIEEPARRRFQQETVPLIREEFAGPGFFGSARAQETVRAGEGLAAGLETARSGLRRESEDINRQGVASLFGFGQAQQAQQQAEINSEIEQFIEQTRLTNPEDVAILMGLLGMNFTTSSSVTKPVGQGSGSKTGAIIGGIAGGLTGFPGGAMAGGQIGGQIGGLF
jgi:hypothetical protein